MSVLLTGGSGFIGSHFHNVLPQNEIVNLDLNEPAFKYNSKFIKGDIRQKADVVKAIEGNKVEYIISLAAKHHDFGIGHDEYFDTNEEGTRIICEAATQFGIKRIIFFSSVAVYGIRPEQSNEELTPIPDSPYGASKLAGEKVLEAWHQEDPTRQVLIIRPTIVFGSNNVANMYNLIRQIDSGVYFHLGKAETIKSIAYVENLVKATLFLRDKLKPGISIYNYADEPQLTTRQISNAIAETLGKRIRFTMPERLGILAGIPFDIFIKLTGKNLPISTARIKKLATSTKHSAEKLFGEGFVPKYTTLQGLQLMVNWYKQTKQR